MLGEALLTPLVCLPYDGTEHFRKMLAVDALGNPLRVILSADQIAGIESEIALWSQKKYGKRMSTTWLFAVPNYREKRGVVWGVV